MAVAAERNLLFGLLALQNGLVDQVGLFAAFRAWTLDRARPLAEHLVARGDLGEDDRAAIEALVVRHIRKHGGSTEKSLAAVAAGRSTRESLGRVADPEIEATLGYLGSTVGIDSTRAGDPDPADGVGVGATTSGGHRFRVLRPHARGGLGAVFVALDAELNREVALKQILPDHADDPVSRARFVVEAEVTGGLEHPGIVPVYGLGAYADGRPYYAMRFIRGESLKEAIERFHADEVLKREPGRRSLELRMLLRRFIDVCNAIDYAHSRGVLHRDIKPSNIIVGKHGETLVVDWGLAKAMGQIEPGSDTGERRLVPSSTSGSAETLPGSALGTPAYMSPEQAGGRLDRLGPRSDVYGLGATLYCLLAGEPPFAGNVDDVLVGVQRGRFRPPRQVDPEIDRALEAVCLRAMALDPADRYATARSLADDVERWAADEPVTAWREPASRRVRRWARRHRTAFTSAAAAMVAAVVGLGAVAGVQARSNSDLKAANRATAAALDQTRAEKTRAEEALAQSEAVRAFLVDVFRSPDPEQDGKDVKVVDVLDRAVRRLDEDVAASEATRGALLDALAQTYQGLGLPATALPLMERASSILERALGPGHADTIRIRSHLVTLLADSAGRPAEAVTLGAANLARAESSLGPDDPQTVECRDDLAGAYQADGQTERAIPIREEILRRREATFGPDDRKTLSSRKALADTLAIAGRTREAIALYEATLGPLEAIERPEHPLNLNLRNNLAVAYYEAGRFPDATRIDEGTLRIREAKLGPDHPDTLTSRNNLAQDYENLGRYPEGLAMNEGTLRMRQAKLGPDHPHTFYSRNNLAMSLQFAGRYAEAMAMHRANLEMRRAKLGPEHPDTLASRRRLAEVELDAGRSGEAIDLLESTIGSMRSVLGPDHLNTIAAVNDLALAYESLGRRTDAESLRRDAMARRRRTAPPESPLLARDLAGLGRNLLEQGRWSEAEPLLRESIAIRAGAFPDDWRRFESMNLLGAALAGEGRSDEAEAMVVGGFEGMKAREARMSVPDRPRLLEAAVRVVRFYEDRGRPDRASAWKVRLGLADLPADVFARP
jgi:tetratricopeptide (TPR) repeat protein/tRNA A-37 threonylcarbamoyl transferase component Bud32